MNPFKPVKVFFIAFLLFYCVYFSHIYFFFSCISLFALIETEVQTLFQNFALIISLFYIFALFPSYQPDLRFVFPYSHFLSENQFSHLSVSHLCHLSSFFLFFFPIPQVYIFLFRIFFFFYIFIPFDFLLLLFHSHLFCLLYFVIFYSFLLCTQSALH